MVNRSIIAWLVAVSIFPTLVLAVLPGETGRDSDKDGIDDGYEQFLLEKLGPVFHLEKSKGTIHPASSLNWCVKHTTGLYDDPDRKKLLWSPKGRQDPVGEFIAACSSKNYGASDYLNLGAPIQKGKVKGDEMTWDRANKEQAGFFGRVCKARGDDNRYWVQYYMFLLFSDSGAKLNIGSHEGDWICLQMDVDVTTKSSPRIETVYYFNHGQIFVVPSSQAPVDPAGRVIAYMEGASNELWPTTTGSEKELPPQTKIIYDKKGVRVRGHKGDSKARYEFRRPLNVGEKNSPMLYQDREQSNEVQLFFLAINWGAWWRDADWFGYSTSSPQSPPHQSKMWDRTGF